MEACVQGYLNHLNKSKDENGNQKKALFDEPVKVFMQVCLHKIPNMINQKQILCKLPNSLYTNDTPEVCLIVKDLVRDKKNRDYEPTVRKYQKLIEENNLKDIIKMVLPLKQMKLEFRPYEIKRKLSTSFNLFIADKCLHEIISHGSHLGREFQKRKKMPIEIDMEKCESNFKKTIEDIISSTIIRLNGKGPIIDIAAFTSTNTVEQAIENINAIKSTLADVIPGGFENVKAIYLKATNEPLTIPIYVSTSTSINQTGDKTINELNLKNNMTENKKLKAKKRELKRLNKDKLKSLKRSLIKKAKKKNLQKA